MIGSHCFNTSYKLVISIGCPQLPILETSKVLSLLEACFDLISGSSLHMKIQIMGGKITENLGYKFLFQKVKKNLSFFHFIFKFSIKNCISLFSNLVLKFGYSEKATKFEKKSSNLFDMNYLVTSEKREIF